MNFTSYQSAHFLLNAKFTSSRNMTSCCILTTSTQQCFWCSVESECNTYMYLCIVLQMPDQVFSIFPHRRQWTCVFVLFIQEYSFSLSIMLSHEMNNLAPYNKRVFIVSLYFCLIYVTDQGSYSIRFSFFGRTVDWSGG